MSIPKLRDPRYRADCSEFFAEPNENAYLEFDGPSEVFRALEDEAEHAGRTFNAQLRYVIDVCFRGRPIHADDNRTIRDWQALAGRLSIRFEPNEPWHSCIVLFRLETNSGRIGKA